MNASRTCLMTVVTLLVASGPLEAAQETTPAPETATQPKTTEPSRPDPSANQLRRLRLCLADQKKHIEQLEADIEQMVLELAELRNENRAHALAIDILRNKPIVVRLGQEGKPEIEKDMAMEAVENKPKWSVQYSMGLIERGGGTRVVRSEGGRVFIRNIRNVDREHVLINGNFKNESLSPYRYSFEIRIGRKSGGNQIIGAWRYQTPLLDPGEIHQFEVKVPVRHVSLIHNYEVGNVEADHPGEAGPLFNEDADNVVAPEDMKNEQEEDQPQELEADNPFLKT